MAKSFLSSGPLATGCNPIETVGREGLRSRQTDSDSGAAATNGEDAAAVQAGRVADNGDTLAIVALIVGIIGLLTGGYSLMTLRRRA
jgi:hypothetical protein